MKLIIFGANGPSGRLLTQQALDEGHTVTAFTRHPEDFPIRHERLHVTGGDLLDLSTVEPAVKGQDAALSTFGVPYSNKPITAFSAGTANIVRAMQHGGVRRLICVSSTALDPLVRDHDTGGGFVFERLLKPFVIHVIGRTAYEDTTRMEAAIMASDLDWTIIRSSGLFETPGVTGYQVSDTFAGRYTSRPDLADAMLRELEANRFVRRVMMVATVEHQPDIIGLVLREAFPWRG